MDVNVRQSDKALIVDIEGDVDMRSATELLGKLDRAAANATVTFAVNLAGVGFMDSSGIAVLIETFKNLKKRDVALVLVGMNRNIREVFNLSRLDQVFTIIDTEDAL